MDKTDLINNKNVETSPLYSEIEYELSRMEDDGDPLVQQDTYIVNWVDLSKDIDELLSKYQDIQVLVWKLRAGLHTEGFESFYKCLDIIFNLIETVNNAETLNEEEKEIIGGFATSLSWLSSSVCVAEAKDSKIYPNEKILIKTIFDIDINGTDSRHVNELITTVEKANEYFLENNLPILEEQIKKNIEYLDKISEYVNNYSSGYSLDCHLLIDFLSILALKSKSINDFYKGNEDMGLEESNHSDTFLENRSNSEMFPFNASVKSRKEVIIALDNILNYFNNYEPSHPAPILIRRIQKMIGMNFEAIIQELLPESNDTLQLYVGRNIINNED